MQNGLLWALCMSLNPIFFASVIFKILTELKKKGSSNHTFFKIFPAHLSIDLHHNSPFPMLLLVMLRQQRSRSIGAWMASIQCQEMQTSADTTDPLMTSVATIRVPRSQTGSSWNRPSRVQVITRTETTLRIPQSAWYIDLMENVKKCNGHTLRKTKEKGSF